MESCSKCIKRPPNFGLKVTFCVLVTAAPPLLTPFFHWSKNNLDSDSPETDISIVFYPSCDTIHCVFRKWKAAMYLWAVLISHQWCCPTCFLIICAGSPALWNPHAAGRAVPNEWGYEPHRKIGLLSRLEDCFCFTEIVSREIRKGNRLSYVVHLTWSELWQSFGEHNFFSILELTVELFSLDPIVFRTCPTSVQCISSLWPF